jgi:regulator of sigma E protease
VLRADGDTIPAWERFVRAVEASPGRPLAVVVLREGVEVALTVTPRATEIRSADGTARTVGKVGLSPYFPVERYGVLGAARQGLAQAGAAGGLVLFTLRGLVTGALSPKDLGGPILIGQLSGEAARLGLDAFFGFMALFSMNLAVLNLLPIPVLDGGHLVFLAIEAVRRKPLSPAQRQRLTQLGFVVLLAIMALAVANDITRLVERFFGG